MHLQPKADEYTTPFVHVPQQLQRRGITSLISWGGEGWRRASVLERRRWGGPSFLPLISRPLWPFVPLPLSFKPGADPFLPEDLPRT